MKQAVVIFLLLAGLTAHSQTVLLNVDRKEESKVSERGPNLKRFTHFYIRGGLFASKDQEGARIIYGSSANLAFGFRKKYKIGNVYSIGFEIENQFTDYKFKQEAGKVIPNTLINNMGRLDFLSLSAGLFNRFNFDPNRGNYLGRFLDIGVSGEWYYSIKYISKNDGLDGTQVKTTTSSLNYPHGANAKVFARLGLSHVSLFASYRLLDVFKPSYYYPDLPKVVVGIDLAVF